MTWLKSTGLDILAHTAVAAVLTMLFGAWPLAAAIIFVREWSQEQAKTGDFSITNAWRFWHWSLDKNLEWAVPAVVCAGIGVFGWQ